MLLTRAVFYFFLDNNSFSFPTGNNSFLILSRQHVFFWFSPPDTAFLISLQKVPVFISPLKTQTRSGFLADNVSFFPQILLDLFFSRQHFLANGCLFISFQTIAVFSFPHRQWLFLIFQENTMFFFPQATAFLFLLRQHLFL